MTNELKLGRLAKRLYDDLELVRDTAETLQAYEAQAYQLILNYFDTVGQLKSEQLGKALDSFTAHHAS